MSKFELRKIESVRGKQDFFELLKDGRSEFGEFCSYLENNSLYLLELRTILSYMQMISDLQKLDGSKYHSLEGCKDVFTEYEIKTKHLRAYLFHIKKEGKIVVSMGIKTNQKRDIGHFRTLKQQFLEQYKPDVK